MSPRGQFQFPYGYGRVNPRFEILSFLWEPDPKDITAIVSMGGRPFSLMRSTRWRMVAESGGRPHRFEFDTNSELEEER